MKNSTAGAAVLMLLLGATAVNAQLPADAVASDIARRYGVSVLKVTPTKVDERDAYAVVVMNPGGNDNGAFEVSTLIVDAASGALVPQFAHRASGYALPPSPDTATPGDDSGPSVRSMTSREYRQR
jgi:hypothetical protein